MRRILVILPDRSPSVIINVVRPLTAMQVAGLIDLAIRMETTVTATDVAEADVIVVSRNSQPVFKPIFELAQQLGIPYVYDIDDHLLEAPIGSYTQRFLNIGGRRQWLETLLTNAALIRAHSPVLAAELRRFNPNVSIVWAPVDWSLVPEKLPDLVENPLHIVYAASAETGAKLYPLMRDDLHAVLDQHGSAIHLDLIGFAPREYRRHPHVTVHPFTSDYAAYFSAFTRFGYAIGLAPMINDLFHNCKTNIKFRDYAAAGAAGIYSDVPLYREQGVINGETGLLVSGEPGSWRTAINRLLTDRDLLERIRRQARVSVETRYRQDVVAEMWMRDFTALPQRPAFKADALRSIRQVTWSFTKVKDDRGWMKFVKEQLRTYLPVETRTWLLDSYRALRVRLQRQPADRENSD